MSAEGKSKEILLLGDGGWGTALAILLSEKGHHATLWGRFPQYTARLLETRVNEKFLPGVEIPDDVDMVSDMAEPMAITARLSCSKSSHGRNGTIVPE